MAGQKQHTVCRKSGGTEKSEIRVATVWEGKTSRTFQGLFKDLKLTFPDLLRRRFCQVTEVLVMTILESMRIFTSHSVSNTD